MTHLLERCSVTAGCGKDGVVTRGTVPRRSFGLLSQIESQHSLRAALLDTWPTGRAADIYRRAEMLSSPIWGTKLDGSFPRFVMLWSHPRLVTVAEPRFRCGG